MIRLHVRKWVTWVVLICSPAAAAQCVVNVFDRIASNKGGG